MQKLKYKCYSPFVQICHSNWARAANGISWPEEQGWEQSLKSHRGGLAFPGKMRLDSLAVLLGTVCSINFGWWAVYSLPSFSSPHTRVARVRSCLQVCLSVPLGKGFLSIHARSQDW